MIIQHEILDKRFSESIKFLEEIQKHYDLVKAFENVYVAYKYGGFVKCMYHEFSKFIAIEDKYLVKYLIEKIKEDNIRERALKYLNSKWTLSFYLNDDRWYDDGKKYLPYNTFYFKVTLCCEDDIGNLYKILFELDDKTNQKTMSCLDSLISVETGYNNFRFKELIEHLKKFKESYENESC
jgi:hypothetical protein